MRSGEWAVALPVLALLWRTDRRRLLRRHLPALTAGLLAVHLATQAVKDHVAAGAGLGAAFAARCAAGGAQLDRISSCRAPDTGGRSPPG